MRWNSPRILAAAAIGLAVCVLAGGGSYLALNDSTNEARAQTGGDGSAGVTIQDLERAIQDTLACLVGRGATVDPIPGEGLRPTIIRAEFPDADGVPDAESARAANEISAECRRQHLDATSEAWSAQQEAPSAAEVEALYRRLEECVAGGGAPGQASVTAGAFTRYANEPRTIAVDEANFEAYSQCAAIVQAETGLVAPRPPWWD